MTLHEAINILSRHNKWRRGEDGAEPVNPTKVGIAIENLLNLYNERMSLLRLELEQLEQEATSDE